MADETPIQADLRMDRSDPLGNSTDVWGRRALHVKIGNRDYEPIPVYITTSNGGDEKHFQFAGSTNPGTTQTIFNIATPLGKRREVHRIVVACRRELKFKVYDDTTLIGSGFTGPQQQNINLAYSPPYVIGENKSLKVDLVFFTGSPITDVEAYLMCLDVNNP